MKGSVPIRCIAVVNRGEAAMRCVRAVKALRAQEGRDLRVVALYTEEDRDAPFVRHADLAVPLAQPTTPVAAYLDHDGLIAAIREGRADAVWPGWGFVAEDAAFVERLGAEGIRFLGPSAEAMRALGDKIAAKELAEKVGVPVTPWSGGAIRDEAHAREAAEQIGFPLVVKASAGGGGRGIRIVDEPDALAEALRSARAEAEAAFGDGRLFMEAKIEGGRHIEVQIAADQHGHVHALGCRDCSVQRRHQKVIEEAPPPGLRGALLDALQKNAIRIASEVGYTGLGTVEFLVSEERHDFLEMNPRLQVEHGITETITGLDLVQLQIRIARGERIADLPTASQGHAIEARVCAEDPDAGFMPTPGQIACFDPALGPRVRLDSGVALGTTVPGTFDSLIAKVVAGGESREEARARLVCALEDFGLVIASGATNKGYLIDVLEAPEFRAGGVDTTWLDRFGAQRGYDAEYAEAALVAAAIIAYQRSRQAARLNFYADTTSISPSRVPRSQGQQIDLTFGGVPYRLEVYAIGSWRYRVHLDGQVVAARLREEGNHAGRLEVQDRTLRVFYDPSDAGLRVEVEGRPYRFGWQTAGEVRASTPAMVVSIGVEPGDEVEAGQALGLVEAMKMEIGFEAPVAGVVIEVRARRGQQVAAGDVLLVIDPRGEGGEEEISQERLCFSAAPDPLAPLFEPADGGLGEPCLEAAEAVDPAARGRAIEAVREEVRRVFLGYDANPERAGRLAAFLEAPLPEGLGEDFLGELADIRSQIALAADVDQLFVRSPGASVSGELGTSNHARLRMLLRRLRAGGVGIAEEFLELVRHALRHYGIHSLEYSDALERAMLRLQASQLAPELRRRLLLAVLRRVVALARRGVPLAADAALADSLSRVAAMRGLVSDAVADAAIEGRYAIFERPEIERQAERTSAHLEHWLGEVEAEPTAPPDDVLLHLIEAPRPVFDRVGGWLSDPDVRRRAIALAAHVRRLYSPEDPVSHATSIHEGGWSERLEYSGGRIVVACACEPSDAGRAAEWLRDSARMERDRHEWPAVYAMELFVPVEAGGDFEPVLAALADTLERGLPAGRFTVNLVVPGGPDVHYTFVPSREGFRLDDSLHRMHPETATRVDLDRLGKFELERCDAPEGIYCFHGRSRDEPGDARVFVLADVRGRSPDAGAEAELFVPIFEQAFYDATRALRVILSERDPKRRLQWNRIMLSLGPAVFLDAEVTERISRRLAPAVRNLGIEKVVVRISVLSREEPDTSARPVEIVISDITGSNMEITSRAPRRNPLEPRSEYERRVAEARSRRLVYPYEIIRMLTGSGKAGGSQETALPPSRFIEYDLEEGSSPPRAVSVEGRPFGGNRCATVIGLISTPTAKVPEGMERVLVLSDPTIGMGALTRPECERVVAAIDLAEERGVPVEWIPVSSGARIAMDSGTENLDATAAVVRRIVTFTQSGGVIHLIVHGVNVGAQSYWNALATMMMHTRGALIMTPGASMVLSGRAALEASGTVSAEDEVAIGGFERIMGPNGEAQYYAVDLADAYRILFDHYAFSYVVPGEAGPRPLASGDPLDRDPGQSPFTGEGFEAVGEIFDDGSNPGRKRPFAMRPVMEALVDRDGGSLERWRSWVGAETAIVWDAHLGGIPVTLIGIESQNVAREGYRPLDGPESWTGGTLFPQSSKKVARALNAASGNRPAVILANLSAFDGSPESMRKLQLEYGAEIARAVVNFEGPIRFLVVTRYHGGAYVVFSQALNPQLRASALTGTYASVIGGGPAATVIFGREVRARASADPRVAALQRTLRERPSPEARGRLESALEEAQLEAQSEIAAEFEAIHTVERAQQVGSLGEILEPARMRAFLVQELRRELS